MKKILFVLPFLAAVPLVAQMPKEAPGKAEASRVTAGTYAVSHHVDITRDRGDGTGGNADISAPLQQRARF